jgi:D-alanyl-D-alanine carboxypeptidase/D-alanyl-D-alanine-endopeptidase (penicillin-binding protein 4)
MPGGAPGDPARLSLVPPLEHYYRVDNRIRTVPGGERKIRIDREAGSRQLRLWGTIARRDTGTVQLLGIEDPALYAAHALYEALTRRGVSIAGRPIAEHLFPNQVPDLEDGLPPEPPAGVEIARRSSAPLLEDLRITDKVSQNLHAELILRAVGRVRRNIGSLEAGLAEMQAFLDEIGVPREAYRLRDGSGLSRLNLVTPAAVMALLRYMYASSERENWLSLLPVGGLDGTLSHRLGAGPAAGRIQAKTGTLSHVMALSGYAHRGAVAPVAFAILVNNFRGPSSEIRGAVDRICTALFE